MPEKKAEAIAWATVNKQTGGGERSGSGRAKPASEKTNARQDSAQRAVTTKKEKTKSDSLESQSKETLLNQAREKNIAGRSTMNKQELILALRKPS